jgi:competence protein ComEA
VAELRDWLEEFACRAGMSGLPRPAVAVGAVLAGALVVVALARWGPFSTPEGFEPAPEVAPGDARAVAPSQPSSLTVHVVGAVATPGVISLPVGSRAGDAVAAAGGLRGDAEASAVNLARVLADGEQLVIPVKGAVPEAGTGAGGSGAGSRGAGGKVNLNTCGVAELDTLPGVGPATADKIVADREKNGPFRRPEDLMRVPGIGAKRFDSLKDLVTTG